MALIICSECGKEISDKANICIHCGFPLKESIQKVSIRFQLSQGQLLYWDCAIYSGGKIIAKCKQGDIAEFICVEPMNVEIKMKGSNTISATVRPGEKYNVARRGFTNKAYLEKVDMLT